MTKIEVTGTGLVYLLDSNVLIALVSRDHTLHDRARGWFRSVERFATCPITEGSLIRFALQTSRNSSLGLGKALLDNFHAMSKHVFWPDDVSYLQVPHERIYGHKQVTDAYLATLAQAHGGLLATMDEALAALHPATRLI